MSLTDIFLDGVLVDVDVSFWSAAKALTPEDLGLKPEEVAEAYKLGRKMLIPEEIIREFRNIESKARRTVEVNSFPFPIGNARFVPKRKFADVLETLKACQSEYMSKVDKLIENYDEYRKRMIPIYREAAETAFLQQDSIGVQEFSLEARENQKEEFVQRFLLRIESYYPSPDLVRSKFSLSWNLYEITFPRMGEVDEETVIGEAEKAKIAREEYRTQIQSKMASFMDQVVGTLRQETMDICNRVLQNLKEGKILKAQTTNSLKDFIRRFQEMNFVGDKEIERKLETLNNEFLSVYNPDQIRENGDLQEDLKRRLHEISESAASITDINSVTGEYKRKITWEE